MVQMGPSKHRTLGYIILFLILCGLLLFLGLIFYYLWILKFGTPEEKQKTAAQFQAGFTTAPGRQVGSSVQEITQETASVIRPHNPTIGEEIAPITIIAFYGFQCQWSQKSYPILKSVMEQYAPAIRVVFKHFPIEPIHPESRSAALAAACAHEQGQFFAYYDYLFEKKALDNGSLIQAAKDIQLDVPTFSRCLQTKKYDKQIEEDLSDGLTLEVRGTPTYIVNKRKVEGAISRELWDTILLEELNKK